MDDLQITGSRRAREWIHGVLEKRFGQMKRQQMPYARTGLHIERTTFDCLRIHQDDFCSKLQPCVIPPERRMKPDSDCSPAEKTTFRSLCCPGLWAGQTRLEELFNIVSLQTHLQSPKIADLQTVNNLTKRLKKNTQKFGIYLWRLQPPFRCVAVTDASAPNKLKELLWALLKI